MNTRYEVEHLCKWIRRAISSCPIQEIRLEHDESLLVRHGNNLRLPPSGVNVSFDSIFDHLAQKHSDTLRVIDLKYSFIGGRALKLICDQCTELEELVVAGGADILTVFKDSCSSMRHLHTASFNIRNVKQSRNFATDDIATEIVQSIPCLKRLAIDGIKWESLWMPDSNSLSGFALQVRRVIPHTLPWERQ